MKRYTQAEIDEMAESGELDAMVARSKARIEAGDPAILTIDGPALVALARVARHPDATDEQIDDAVAAARKAGHTWTEIEPVLHAARGRVTA
ncbi:hypothetical protein [Desertimonas flava]|uniref:hypothetical protein n=1 Tax=Desertimonas flava TaxID=2064846 RepID=UPI000E343053|nr:hypothetical protein [Desertimonas flava]